MSLNVFTLSKKHKADPAWQYPWRKSTWWYNLSHWSSGLTRAFQRGGLNTSDMNADCILRMTSLMLLINSHNTSIQPCTPKSNKTSSQKNGGYENCTEELNLGRDVKINNEGKCNNVDGKCTLLWYDSIYRFCKTAIISLQKLFFFLKFFFIKLIKLPNVT